MLHEIEMNLRAGRHPNVVQCKGLCSKSEQELLLIMEYCPRRSFAELLHVMKCKGRHIDPFKLLGFLRSVARGLQYLHSRGILHRDVKPGNCFVGAHQVLKLGDLGHACHVHQGGLELLPPSPDTPEALQWGPSTPEFSAPETWHPLRLPRPLDIQLVLKTDVWSFGVLLWQACMLRNPYDEFGAARRARLLVCGVVFICMSLRWKSQSVVYNTILQHTIVDGFFNNRPCIPLDSTKHCACPRCSHLPATHPSMWWCYMKSWACWWSGACIQSLLCGRV